MAPPTLLERDIGQDVANAQNTFTSWDACMAESYCKYPVIVGIVIGCLIVISIVWCCARCLCCGLECCCGICSCFNRCCPSPRNRNNQGYQQTPVQPYQQYQSHPSPMYGGAYGASGYGYRGAQTATFDAPTKKDGSYNEDALPAMPSWNQAASRRVEEEEDYVEMEKLNNQQAEQQQGLLNKDRDSGGRYYNPPAQQDPAGDLGTMQAGPYYDHDNDQYQNQYQGQYQNPYQDQYQGQYQNQYQDQHQGLYQNQYQNQQHSAYAASPVSAMANQQYTAYSSPVSATAHSPHYPPTYHTRPQSSVYESAYSPSVPPSYHTAAAPNPTQQQAMPTSGGGYGRKPVQGSWRDV